MKGEILFLAHRLPFPPDRGDKIRSHHVLKHLASIAPVHVATFADDPDDFDHEADLAAIAASHCLVERVKPLWRAGIEALARSEPVSLAAFRDARLAAYVAQTLRLRGIAAIYVFSGQMGQYVPAGFKGRVVMDLVDVDSAKFEAYGDNGAWPRRWIDAREGRLLRAEEARLASRGDVTLLVSDAEAGLLRSRLADSAQADVRTLGNGIDARFFNPEHVLAHPALTLCAGPHLVFTGQMDYPPNVEAALRLMERILPRIRERHPEAQAHIVGRAPVHVLRAHDGRNGCRVWGAVKDIRPFIAAADLMVAPLVIARGVQNKVLEAMAMARPVLVSAEAATGIDGLDGVHLAIGDDDDALVARALALLADRGSASAMGKAARAFVLGSKSWPATLAPLGQFISTDPQGAGHRDAA